MDTLKLSAACRSSSLGSADFGEVAALVTAYTDYLQSLTGLCGRGVQLIRNFVGPCSVAYMLPSKEKEEAQKLWAIWEDINKSMQQSVWSVRTQSLQSLQDWLQQKSKEANLQECPSQSDDLSKLITACLVAFTQLQFQFSSLCCHSFTELDLVRFEHNSGGESGTNSLSLICEDEVDKERRDSGNVSDDLTMSSIADPMISQLQLGRRSSYELGNLHTASPPPPSADSLGRRWSMPTEDLVLDENKISPHFTGSSMEKKREILVSHEELDNVINLLSFNHGSAATMPNSSSNIGINKLNLASNNKLDNLSLPQPSRGSNSKYGHHQHARQHEQQQSLLELRSRSSKNVSNNAGSGLLSVASMISPDCKELQASRKILKHAGSTGLGTGERELGVNKEGAFSIGLNLVGSDLMASVQQKQNEENKSTLPHIIIPEENDKNAHTQSSLGDRNWLSGEAVFPPETEHPQPDFLHFSLNTSPGNSIWTPSQNDYSSPKGNYYF